MKEHKATILSTVLLDPLLVSQAADEDILVDCEPFTEIEFIQNNALAQSIAPLLNKTTIVVFTSVNAVKSTAQYTKDKKANWQIYCMSQATKTTVEEYFGDDALVGTGDSATSLANTFAKDGIKQVVFFCGDKRRDELPEILAKANIGVQEIVVYHTIETPVKIIEQFDAILFFSPSGVHSFFAVNSILPSTILFAIGSTTAKALQQATFNPVIVSDVPSKKAVVELAIEYFQEQTTLEEDTHE